MTNQPSKKPMFSHCRDIDGQHSAAQPNDKLSGEGREKWRSEDFAGISSSNLVQLVGEHPGQPA